MLSHRRYCGSTRNNPAAKIYCLGQLADENEQREYSTTIISQRANVKEGVTDGTSVAEHIAEECVERVRKMVLLLVNGKEEV